MKLTDYATPTPVVRVAAHQVGLLGRLATGRGLQLFGGPEIGPPPQTATDDRGIGEQERSDGHALGRVHAAGVHCPEQRLQLPVVQPFEQRVAKLPFVRLGGGMCGRLLLQRRRRRRGRSRRSR